jgi:hypothetical protein
MGRDQRNPAIDRFIKLENTHLIIRMYRLIKGEFKINTLCSLIVLKRPSSTLSFQAYFFTFIMIAYLTLALALMHIASNYG